MLAHFPSTNGYLTRLDLGHVSGVPILEALPSQAWHIPPHFMKNSNDPLAQVMGRLCPTWCTFSALVCTYRHQSALIGISLHLSALVCTYRHWSALIGISLHLSALVCTYRHQSALSGISLHLSANSLHFPRKRFCTQPALLGINPHQLRASCGDMLAHFPSTNGYLTRLDLGHVSGVPILEALPSQAWHIPPHFMKNSNDPLAQVMGRLCPTWCTFSALVCTYRHQSALIGISLHLSALVCTYRHWSALIGISLHLSALVCTYWHQSKLSGISLHLSASSLHLPRKRFCTQPALLGINPHQSRASFGDMLAHFPSTNGYLTRLDLGQVSGVPILEALPSQAWHIPPHFMKNSNDPLAQVMGRLCPTWCAFSALVCTYRHQSALIGISLHLSAYIVCTQPARDVELRRHYFAQIHTSQRLLLETCGPIFRQQTGTLQGQIWGMFLGYPFWRLSPVRLGTSLHIL